MNLKAEMKRLERAFIWYLTLKTDANLSDGEAQKLETATEKLIDFYDRYEREKLFVKAASDLIDRMEQLNNLMNSKEKAALARG